jgi:hypothetical protein
MIEAAVEKVVQELKESIGLPFQIDGLPGSFKIKAPYASWEDSRLSELGK